MPTFNLKPTNSSLDIITHDPTPSKAIDVTEVVKDVTEVVKDTTLTGTKTPTVPRNLFRGFSEVLREQQLIVATQICEKFGLDLEDVIKSCIPNAPEISTKKKPATSNKKNKITDYNDAKSKDDLKSSFKITELKEICKDNNLPLSGSKQKLIDRVWGILHPDQAPNEPVKKRGRKPKAKTTDNSQPVIVHEIVNEVKEESCELNPEDMKNIFINSDGNISENESDGFATYKILKNFVFKEGDDDFDFKGIYDETDNKVTFTDEYPPELLKMFGMD